MNPHGSTTLLKKKNIPSSVEVCPHLHTILVNFLLQSKHNSVEVSIWFHHFKKIIFHTSSNIQFSFAWFCTYINVTILYTFFCNLIFFTWCFVRKNHSGSSCCSAVTNLTNNHEDTGLTHGLTQRIKYLALPWAVV